MGIVDIVVSKDENLGKVTYITSKRSLLHIPFRELWEYRELIGLLAHRDFVSQYKQTILGSFWYVLQPLFQSFMFIFVFTKVAKVPTADLPPMLFYLSGIVCWRYFSECVTKTANTFTGNQHLFDKVYFPRLAVPISQLITNLVGFGMGLVLFLGFYLWFYFHGAAIHPDWRLIVVPVLVIQMAALGLGVGCLISGMTNRFRDLQVLLGFFMQLWMYASCVVYPLRVVPESYRWIYDFNPIVFVIESFRFAFMGEGTVTFSQVAISAVLSLGILFLGLIVFNKVEQTSVDTA
jgi:lipopolysaccharide transport system permease protein